MATIVYSTSPNRVVSSVNQNQYGSYSSVNKSVLSNQHHHITGAPPVMYQQGKEHHNNYLMSHSRNYKRKSAVELLAETKSYYVKSENVLDRHQQLNNARSSTLSCESFLFFFIQKCSYFSDHIVYL